MNSGEERRMRTIRYVKKTCLSCNKIHNVRIVERDETVSLHGVEITFPAMYEYCEEYDEMTETEELMDENYKTMMKELSKKTEVIK